MGRDALIEGIFESLDISIHSPRMGRDTTAPSTRLGSGNFNPLSPHGERPAELSSFAVSCNFNPLSPHGERHHDVVGRVHSRLFQSTLPAWGETAAEAMLGRYLGISIHSPRMGRDIIRGSFLSRALYFNPLSPHGERRTCRPVPPPPYHFNPLSPHGERPARISATFFP